VNRLPGDEASGKGEERRENRVEGRETRGQIAPIAHTSHFARGQPLFGPSSRAQTLYARACTKASHKTEFGKILPARNVKEFNEQFTVIAKFHFIHSQESEAMQLDQKNK